MNKILSYSSLVNPRTVYEFDMETQNESIKKITACRVREKMRDDTNPVTKRPNENPSVDCVQRKRQRQGPLLLRGYGRMVFRTIRHLTAL